MPYWRHSHQKRLRWPIASQSWPIVTPTPYWPLSHRHQSEVNFVFGEVVRGCTWWVSTKLYLSGSTHCMWSLSLQPLLSSSKLWPSNGFIWIFIDTCRHCVALYAKDRVKQSVVASLETSRKISRDSALHSRQPSFASSYQVDNQASWNTNAKIQNYSRLAIHFWIVQLTNHHQNYHHANNFGHFIPDMLGTSAWLSESVHKG